MKIWNSPPPTQGSTQTPTCAAYVSQKSILSCSSQKGPHWTIDQNFIQAADTKPTTFSANPMEDRKDQMTSTSSTSLSHILSLSSSYLDPGPVSKTLMFLSTIRFSDECRPVVCMKHYVRIKVDSKWILFLISYIYIYIYIYFFVYSVFFFWMKYAVR